MKTKIKIISLISLSLAFFSCEENITSDFYPDNTNVSGLGGYITVKEKSIAYTIGNGSTFQYKNSFSASQAGEIKISKVNIYKSYLNTKGTADEVDDELSNEILFKTINVPLNNNSDNVVVPFSFTYPELVEGLKINGISVAPLDTGLNIGDSFKLRYEQLRSDGKTVQSSSASNTTKVSVGTRLAGKYKCNVGIYYRIGVLSASSGAVNWPAETIIESVDATTYKIVGRMGLFPPTATDPNNILFLVNGSVLTYSPLQTTGNDQPFITCTSSPGNFNPEVLCGSSNKVELDLVGGKDKIFMTFGYLSPSGPRVFYQELEKIVE